MALTLTKQKTTQKKPRPVTAFTPALPSVNLLSAGLQEALALRVLKRRFIAAGVGLLVIAGLAGGVQQTAISSAQHSLDQATAQNQTLNTQKQGLQKVASYYAQVTQDQTAIQTAMSKEVLYDQVLLALSSAAPAGVTLGNISLTVNTTPSGSAAAGTAATSTTAQSGGSCPTPDPFSKVASVGCITLVGSAANRDVVGTWLSNLNNDPRFVNAFVSSTTSDDKGVVAFDATVGLTDKVYSGRYKDVNFLRKAGQ